MINSPNGSVYAFNKDAVKRVGEDELPLGNVRSCFSVAQVSNSGNYVEENNVINNGFVFGAGADKTCFYDVYATGVSDNTNAIRLITSQMNKGFEKSSTLLSKNYLMNLDLFKNSSNKINYESYISDNFVFNGLTNYGYPSFGNSYASDVITTLKIEGFNNSKTNFSGKYWNI